jgi:hypothetical protein
MPKTSISRRIQKFRKGALRIFPLDGQIQGEVVVGTTPGLHFLGLGSFMGVVNHLELLEKNYG